MTSVGESAAVHQLPEMIRRVRVGMASLSGLEAGIQTDHQEHEPRSDAVDEVVDWRVRVFGADGFARAAAFGGLG